eukprot:m.128384 g.128384  ORF g.128384 m.128384 type:complete len:802 (+) comp9452_c0_seq1:33-2438(+)
MGALSLHRSLLLLPSSLLKVTSASASGRFLNTNASSICNNVHYGMNGGTVDWRNRHTFCHPFQARYASYDARNRRVDLFNSLQTKHAQELASIASPIKVKVDGHGSLKVDSHVTAPGMLLRGVSGKAKVVACYVNGQLWDLRRPLVESCTVKFLQWDTHWDDLMELCWHSGAHVVGAAMEEFYGDDILLCDGPPLQRGSKGGFYYEGHIRDGKTLTKDVLNDISDHIAKMCQSQSLFHRIEVSVEEARDVFRDNPFKLHFLSKIASRGVERVALYRVGKFVDLCDGPHVPSAKLLQGTISLTRTSHADFSWNGRESDKPSAMEGVVDMQRLYGISFPHKKIKKVWIEQQEQLEKVRHTHLMKDLSLVLMHPHSPGAPFFLPHGVRVVERLKQFLRRLYSEYNYDEVMTPLVFSHQLWETSGHWEHYREDMYKVSEFSSQESGNETNGKGDHEQLKGLKPMNCPAHCLVYKSTQRSYRDLPLRLSEFTPLHRNEPSGGLTGLTRVRQFHQDDAHIFCLLSQIETEVAQCLEFVRRVYARCGFDYYFALSTRPKEFVGTIEAWDVAEAQLKRCLHQHNMPFKLNEQDGAFYGPKIDIYLRDVFRREHQTATIQLDFQLPQRFNLTYIDAGDEKNEDKKRNSEEETVSRPVIIHRAILGSIERMMALLLENTHGRLPVWCSPRQVACVSVNENTVETTRNLVQYLKMNGIHAEALIHNDTIGKKVRAAIKERFNYILVVGEKEMETQKYLVRHRDENKHIVTLPDAVQAILKQDQSVFGETAEQGDGFKASQIVEKIQARVVEE